MSSLGDVVTLSGAAQAAAERAVPVLVHDRVASAISRRDPTLWGPAAADEAARRLGWVDLPMASRPLVAEIAAVRARAHADGADHVVLAGMGGSSLAPEVITATAGVPLTVLDSTDPDQVRRALTDRLERTVLVVSSKSGTTVETDSQRRAYEQAFRAVGLDPARRIVVVTDPGSPLEAAAHDAGYVVITADPQVGGRYSALSAFGLVPAGLAGADVGRLLDEAAAMAPRLSADDPANPALRLGAALAGTSPLRDKVVLADPGPGLVGLSDWVEQLVAESTGKDGTGLLPLVVEGLDAPDVTRPTTDSLVVRLSGPADVGAGTAGVAAPDVVVVGTLGGQMLLWEYATAVAGRLLGINPFDQPDVESAKAAARGLLAAARPADDPPVFVDAGIEVRASGGLLPAGTDDLAGAVASLLEALARTTGGYLAVTAYLDRVGDAGLAGVRPALARRTHRPVTFGWGPRFLHSTGQYHKGGPPTGVFLQVTGAPTVDAEVPGREFTFGRLIAAQAAGDADVLARRGRPVLRLHLTDRAAGVARLLEVLT